MTGLVPGGGRRGPLRPADARPAGGRRPTSSGAWSATACARRGDHGEATRRRGSASEAWLDHLRVERGLAENTLLAYERDLRALAAHAEARGRSLLELGQADLAEFIGALRERGLGPRSQARHLFAARGFYRFALREGLVARDPTENLRPPKAFRALPRYLTPAQVETLLAAPDVATPVGLRDRAVLEVMYATGLRASELTGLTTEGARHGARRRARPREGPQGAARPPRPGGAALGEALRVGGPRRRSPEPAAGRARSSS